MAELVVVYGPSGAGKTTLIKRLMNSESKFSLNVSHTTRSPRPKEEDGVHYHFTNEIKFEEMKSQGEFLETFEYIGNKYGTSFKSIENCLVKQKIPVLDINVKTVQEIKDNEFIIKKSPIYLFIKPPSLEELQRRLENRGDSEESVHERMKYAPTEIKEGPSYADEIFINDDMDATYDGFKNYILNQCNLLQ